MRRKHWFSLLALIVAIVLAIGIGSIRNSQPPITIGVIVPLTGNLSFFGQGNKNALSLFQKSNQDVKFEYFDSKGLPSSGMTAARRVVDQGNQYAITSFSYIVNTIQPIFDQARVANFTLSMDDRAEKKSFYNLRLYPTMQQEMDKFNVLIQKKGYKKILFFYNNVESLAHVIEVYFRNRLPNDVMLITAPYPENASDFRNIISKFSSENPDAIRIMDFGDKLSSLLTQLEESGFYSNIPIYSGIEALLIDPRSLPRSVTDRFRFTAPKVFLDDSNPVVNAYKKTFGKAPTYDAIMAYDIAQLLVPEIRRYGYSNVDSVIKAIIAKKQFNGAAAQYQINSNGGITPQIYWARFMNDRIIFNH